MAEGGDDTMGGEQPAPGQPDPLEHAFNTLRQEVHSVNVILGVQGAAQNIKPFNGENKSAFREWVRDIEKYRTMLVMAENNCILLAYQASKGAVSGFIERYRREHPNATWGELKVELASRFSDVADRNVALTLLRQIKQKHGESLNLYAERLMSISYEAFEDEQAPGVQAQLIDIFVSGLNNDQLKLTILRRNPDTLITAVGIATAEANLRNRINLSASSGKNSSKLSFWDKEPKISSSSHEPMEIDHSRGYKCFKCGMKGHRANRCQKVNVVQQHGQAKVRCFACGKFGHYARKCQQASQGGLN